MKKKILLIILSIILLILIIVGFVFAYQKYRIAHATIKVTLQDNLNIEVYSNVKLKDLIKNINGQITKNFSIDTTTLGEQEISFSYKNDDNIKVPYKFKINIVDTTPPIISQYNTYSITVNQDENVEEQLFCGDNYDDKPKCELIGNYNKDEVGTYPVTFKATDSSNNISSYDFNIVVKEPPKNSSSTPSLPVTTDFNEVKNNYKTKDNKIGIDVSHWQGDIDFSQVKEAGVEFAIIRLGSQRGIDGEYFIDDKFEQNIKGFNEVNIPVGIYFYSYSKNKKAAIKEAKWIINKIKKYDISLPIVFDWENWSFYQEFNLSFYHLTEMANAFLETIEKKGYTGMLYSSKNYLENIWMDTPYPIWLAHYTDKTDYEGSYKIWQLCSNGKVAGIKDNTVDIDIMY